MIEFFLIIGLGGTIGIILKSNEFGHSFFNIILLIVGWFAFLGITFLVFLLIANFSKEGRKREIQRIREQKEVEQLYTKLIKIKEETLKDMERCATTPESKRLLEVCKINNRLGGLTQ